MFKQELILTLVRFGLVGSTVTLVFMGLNRWLGPKLGKNKAFLVAYPPTVALHFCLNKWWTFGAPRTDASRQISQYIVLTLVAFLIQLGIFQLLTRYTRLRPWLASGVATVAQMALAFFVMRH